MLTIKKLKCGAYRVSHLFTEYSDTCYPDIKSALNLCRLRQDKCKGCELEHEQLVVIHLPFTNWWLVW